MRSSLWCVCCCWPSFLGGEGEILIICQKSSYETPESLVQPWGHSTAAMNLCQVGILPIASVKKYVFFLLSAIISLKTASVFDKQCIDAHLLICFPTQFFISHFSMSHQKLFKFMLFL